MKPAILCSLTLSFCLFLTACGSGGSSETPTDGDITLPTPAPEVPSTPEPSVEPSAEPSVAPSIAPTPNPSTEPTPIPETQTWRLDWVAPDQRVDGSALTDAEISGYVIKWTNTTSQETGEVDVEAGVSKHQLELPAGNYQFEIATKDIYGRLSQFVTPQN
ncbi:hypothetical protein [Motilimonas eburnea]|uniref:hypothetical protein n=1 Tax=Motilimonas eburnea TaxID=1737488 RepID=UPI001E604FA4|nr:hypothetical protein [Motilimonas eburnea]MCE2572718.1 hypothetical protein [Motilimonas eburnea]